MRRNSALSALVGMAMLGAMGAAVATGEPAPERKRKPKPVPPSDLPPSTMTRQQRRHAERQALKRLPKS